MVTYVATAMSDDRCGMTKYYLNLNQPTNGWSEMYFKGA